MSVYRLVDAGRATGRNKSFCFKHLAVIETIANNRG
jgi:hypothetical protein